MGKSGQEQRKAVTDARLRRVEEECRDLPGYEVFKYLDDSGGVRDVRSRDLNAYVKEAVGPQFTGEDLRTWAGPLIAASTLPGLGASQDAKAAQKKLARGGRRGGPQAREHQGRRAGLLH